MQFLPKSKFICKTGILFKMYKIYIEMQEIKKN